MMVMTSSQGSSISMVTMVRTTMIPYGTVFVVNLKRAQSIGLGNRESEIGKSHPKDPKDPIRIGLMPALSYHHLIGTYHVSYYDSTVHSVYRYS